MISKKRAAVRIFAALTAASLAAGSLPVTHPQAASEAYISSPAAAVIGSEISVDFAVQSEQLTDAEVTVYWDSSRLEIKSLSYGTSVKAAALYPDKRVIQLTASATSSRMYVMYATFKVIGSPGTASFRISGSVWSTAGTAAASPVELTKSMQVTSAGSSVATLASLSVSGYSISPAFSQERTEYTVSVGNSVSKLDLAWKTTDPNATVAVSGNSLAENATTGVHVTVTAENGNTRDYVIKAFRVGKSSNSYLSALSVAGCPLTPAFAHNVYEYSVAVSADTASLNISCTPADSGASAAVTGNQLAENATTAVTVRVTAQDGTSRDYVIKATRASGSSDSYLSGLSVTGCTLSPSFSRDRTEYSLNVPNSVASLALTYQTSDSRSKVTVSGNALAEGAETPVSVKVTAQDGSSRTYVIKAFRAQKSSDSYLTSLAAQGYSLTPPFAVNLTDYSISVPYEASKLDLTWKASDPMATVTVTGNSLAENAVTPVSVKVTAQDGSSRTYVIKASRAARSSDSRLSGLSVTGCTLVPLFTRDRLEYTVSVGSAATKLDLVYTTSDPKATVTVTGNSLAENGATPVSVRVTAEDGTSSTYVIRATRAAKSPDNALSSLSVAGYPLDPAFSAARLDYTVAVGSETSKLDISWKTSDPKASVTVTGNALAENAVTPVSVTVTAEDGSSRTYVIRAARGASDNRLASLSIAGYALSPAFSPDRLEYSVYTAAETQKLILTCKASDPKASVSVTGNDLAENAVTAVSVKVTGTDGGVRVYTIKAYRPGPAPEGASDDCSLEYLVPSSGTLTPAFSKNVLAYRVKVASEQKTIEFRTKTTDAKAYVLTSGPTRLEPDRENVFYFYVTAENGVKRAYTVSVTSSDSIFSNPPVEPQDPVTGLWNPGDGAAERMNGTMILSASLLNSIFRAPGTSVTVSNPVGQVSVSSEGVRNVSRPYYDMTLTYSTRHEISADVPGDAMLVSTMEDGDLFGDALFQIFVTGAEAQNVYSWDPAKGVFTLLARDILPQNGTVSFTSNVGGTFVLSGEIIQGAVDALSEKERAGFLGSPTALVIMTSAVMVVFCMAYLTGVLSEKKRSAVRSKVSAAGKSGK